MICPNCEYEYVEGITVCADCGSQLVPNSDFEGHLTNPRDYVIVYTCSETYEAEMLKANLQGAEIEALVLSQKDSSYPAVGDLAVVKLLVKKEDASVAIEIINDINSNSTN